MKFTYFISVIFLIGVTRSHGKEIEEEVKKAHEQCQANPQTSVNKIIYEDLIKGEEVHHSTINAHLFCINVKLNIQKQNGDIISETIKKYLAGLQDEAAINLKVQECGNRSEDDTAEVTAMKLWKCLHNKKKVPRYQQLLKEMHKECMSSSDTRVNGVILDQLRKGQLVDDSKIGEHLLCMHFKLGYQIPNGDIDKDVLKTDLKSKINDKNKINEIVEECAKRSEGDSRGVTAFKLYQCLHKNGAPGIHDNILGHGGHVGGSGHGRHGGQRRHSI